MRVSKPALVGHQHYVGVPTGVLVYLCFASSSPLTITRLHCTPPSSQFPVCRLAPNKRGATDTHHPDISPARTHRVLADNLRASERPPQPPRHWSVPIIGLFIEKALGTFKTPEERRQKYGPIYFSNFFLGPKMYVTDYNAIYELMRNAEVFRSKGAMAGLEKVCGEESMIALDGKQHSEARGSIAPALAPNLFPYYFKRVLSRAHKTWDSVHTAANRGEKVLLSPVLRKHYLAIVIEITTGVDMDGKYSERIPKLFDQVMQLFFTPEFFSKHEQAMRARQELIEILAEIVRWDLANRADTIRKLREYGDDVVKLSLKDVARGELDMLLVSIASSSLSIEPGAIPDDSVVESLCNSMLLLWLAGFATAAATTMNASFEIGFNDSLCTQLMAEQNKIIAEEGGKIEVTYEQTVSKMPLLDSFLIEVLRFRPAVNGMMRKTVRDIELLGYFVPKDSIILCQFQVAHRDPKLYPNPDTLKPDRFVKKEGVPKPPTILSYGPPGSAHYCIGAAFSKVLMKTTLATLLREYSYSLDPEQSRLHTAFPEPSPESGIVLDSFERRKL